MKLLYLCLLPLSLSAQDDLAPLPHNVLKNPSFERGAPARGMEPVGWLDCGETGESPADVHGNDRTYNFFSIRELAAYGEQFLGMVVRSNGTTECIYQRFRKPLDPGEYVIRITAARPREARSLDRVTGAPASYTQPVLLEMTGKFEDAPKPWGVLAQTPAVLSSDWTTWEFRFELKYPLRQFKLSAQYADAGTYNGYVLVDRVELAPVLD